MAASCPPIDSRADSLVPDPTDRKSDTDPLVAEPIEVPVRGEVDTDSVLVDSVDRNDYLCKPSLLS